jgi:phospholipase C
MLGNLYPQSPLFEGLSIDMANYFSSVRYPVWKSSTMDEVAVCIPTVDPGEYFVDMNEQLFGSQTTNIQPAPMNGFVKNYATQPATGPAIDPFEVMHYFTPEQLPVLSTLARAFAVCDQWYASAPCQTWPNRFFVHTGTCLGYVNNNDFPIPFTAPSIFKRLDEKGKSWRVYFHDLPQSILLEDVWLKAPLHYRLFHQFLIDAENGALPNYSFIEPRYFPDVLLNDIPNDQHPPHNVLQGEQLIAAVYNALRKSPCWKNSLLIITYDEHGGCFDHMPPPAAESPDGRDRSGFNFNRYGVRVPAVIVSPYVRPGSVIRNVAGGVPLAGPPYPFDHTSILSTLRDLFGLGEPLTERDNVAPSLLSALTLNGPDNDGPMSVQANATPPSIGVVGKLVEASLNHMQSALVEMLAKLPARPLTSSGGPLAATDRSAPATSNLSAAASYAVAHVKAFLGM